LRKAALFIFTVFLFPSIFFGCLDGDKSRIHTEIDNWDDYPGFAGSDYSIAKLEETPEAFPNPMKGFRPGTGPDGSYFQPHEYARVYKHYIRYADLEAMNGDTAQKIIDWSKRTWKDIEKRNIKVIPRVVLTFPMNNKPEAPALNYWPHDIPQPSSISRWHTQELKDRLLAFSKKLGEAWDNDPRVAAIELGLWGYWGEHHLLFNGRIPSSFQNVLGDAFMEAFHNKKVMVRYPETFKKYQFGFYWDSFALPDDSAGGYGIIRRNVWKTQMISGEVAYDWGNRSQLGKNPNETLGNDKYTDYVITWIMRTHASSLGWIAEYNQHYSEIKTNTARIQKALGYRFVIRSGMYKEMVHPGEEMVIGFKVSNIGAAPFYYQWPVEISLLDHNHKPVWKNLLNPDIRSWLPGETNTITESFTVPQALKKGTYIVAIAICDPSGNVPSLRFANIQYYTGGRTPLGVVGVGVEPELTELAPFDSLYSDNSLLYKVE
jgi:hypothetical protein